MIKIDLEILQILLERAKNGEIEPSDVKLDKFDGWVTDGEYDYCLVEEK